MTMQVAALPLIALPALGMAPALGNSDAEDDAARIEEKFQIRQMSQEIMEKSRRRTEEAAENSPTIQNNNQIMQKGLDSCLAESEGRLKEVINGRLSADDAKYLLLECGQDVIRRNPNAEILDELFWEFVAEELDRLRDEITEHQRREVEKRFRNCLFDS